MFNLKDAVRKIEQHEVWTVEVLRGAEPRYQIQLGNDSASREWANEGDLELVANRREADGGPGFVPDEPLF